MELSEKKQAFIASSGHQLALGGPGCGKTTSALLKAARCIDGGSYKPWQKVLFLSFARATVARVAEQATGILDQEVRKQLDLSTYHSFAWNILKSHGYLLFGREPFRLLPPPQATVRLVNCGADSAAKVAEKERLLREERLLDFDLFAGKAAEVLRRAPRLAAVIGSSHPLIILDEFQDTNSDEWALVQVLGQHSTLVALADEEQRIYEFRGAAPERIGQFTSRFNPSITDFSDENHRCPGSDIPQFTRNLLEGEVSSQTYHDVAIRRYQTPRPIEQTYRLAKMEVLNSLRRCRKGGLESFAIGVFVPTKAMMAALSDYFLQPTANLGVIDHHVAFDANAAALAAETIAILLSSNSISDAPKAVIDSVLRHLRGRNDEITGQDRRDADFLEEHRAGKRRASGKNQKLLVDECARITHECIKQEWTGSPGEDWKRVVTLLSGCSSGCLSQIGKDAKYVRLLRKGAALNRTLTECWRSKGHYGSALEDVRSALLQEHFSMASQSPQGVHLMNLHKTKGKQFREVIIIEGWQRDRFLPPRVAEDPKGRQQALYLLRVGVSRAEKRVTILTPSIDTCPFLL
jgi:DNA helicase-2/ATP-dependent DNA helicase PcrA